MIYGIDPVPKANRIFKISKSNKPGYRIYSYYELKGRGQINPIRKNLYKTARKLGQGEKGSFLAFEQNKEGGGYQIQRVN